MKRATQLSMTSNPTCPASFDDVTCAPGLGWLTDTDHHAVITAAAQAHGTSDAV